MIALIASAGLPAVSSGTVQFEAEGTVTGWEAVINYEINANWTNVTNHWVDGDFSDVITCNVDWVLVTEETTSTDRDNLRQYALDYDEGEFGFLEVKNGTQTKKVHVCSSFDLHETNDSNGHWDTFEHCVDGGPNGEDSDGTGPELMLGTGDTGFDHQVTDQEAGRCLTLYTGDTTSPTWLVPYTGWARARLESQSDDFAVKHEIDMKAVYGVLIPQSKTVQEADNGPCDPDPEGCWLIGGQQHLFGTDTPGVGHIKASVET